MESFLTSSYETDESYESEDSSLKQERVSPAPTGRDQGKDQLCPVMFIKETDILGAYRDESISPAASYNSMTSDQSMNCPLKFSHEPDVMRIHGAASPAPTLASVQSEQPMGPRESYCSLMMKDHLRCSVCKDMLKEPMSIPCGHSFCKTCILSYWTKAAHAGSYPCPQCRKRFKTRPSLNLNVTLANVVQTQQQAEFSPAFLTQSYTGPGDVACDTCSGSRIRAVKSCLTCCASCCETHVRQHYAVEAPQRDTVMELTKDLERGVYKLGKTNPPAEVVRTDLMSNMMNRMQQLQNEVNKMAVKLEVLERSTTGQAPKKIHTEHEVGPQ